MTKKAKLLLLSTILMTLAGCGEGSNVSPTKVDEFVSLDQKANVEYGELSIAGEKINLSYSGALMQRDGYSGFIGLFVENKKEQIAAITSEDGITPTEGKLAINIPDIPNGYICENFSLAEASSMKIKNTQVINIIADACLGQGKNVGKTTHVELRLTESMFSAGTSQLAIRGEKAYLNTEYRINAYTTLSGGLGTRAYNQIFDLVHQHPEVKILVEEQISGSIHDAINMQTGRLVRKARLATHIGKNSDIASGGVDLFCAGIKRTMEDGAKVGVHSWSDEKGTEAGNLSKDNPLHKDQIDYFTEMLGSPIGEEFYFYTIYAASAGEIYQMSRVEMQSFHMLTE
jgi:hypothetical protein